GRARRVDPTQLRPGGGGVRGAPVRRARRETARSRPARLLRRA
ncbi:MAG: hypothetical protein AVDCRST_MAG19-1780, partial [uncultured Thermomicrobiales bacterium]